MESNKKVRENLFHGKGFVVSSIFLNLKFQNILRVLSPHWPCQALKILGRPEPLPPSLTSNPALLFTFLFTSPPPFPSYPPLPFLSLSLLTPTFSSGVLPPHTRTVVAPLCSHPPHHLEYCHYCLSTPLHPPTGLSSSLSPLLPSLLLPSLLLPPSLQLVVVVPAPPPPLSSPPGGWQAACAQLWSS